jgi:hypothetical protein
VALARVSSCPASLIGSKQYPKIPMHTNENIKLSYKQYQDDLKRKLKYEGLGVRLSNKKPLLCYRQLRFY